MATYYNNTDLISFGNYLLSEERALRMKFNKLSDDVDIRLLQVTHANRMNWLDSINKNKEARSVIDSDIIRKALKALSLMNSMILSGENHSSQSMATLNNALEDLRMVRDS